MAAPPLLVVGLDGAGLDLVERWARAGRMPAMAALLEAGAYGRLRSTVPAATFPAWTSLVTGVNPGRHGVLDFAERVPGTLRIRFVNGSRRSVPAFWRRAADEGRRVVAVTVPATYPPERLVGGVMVSGFDTPLTAAIDGSFVAPPERWPEIVRAVGRVPFADFQEVAPGPGWHDRARDSLLDGVERRARLTEHLIRAVRPDVCMVVFGESDTASHHFWRFHDPGSPRWVPSAWGSVLGDVYAALDGAVARLVAAYDVAPNVVVVSDHGSGGAGTRGLHMNRRLADAGLLAFRATGRPGLASGMRRFALRRIPFRWQAGLLRRFGGMAGRLEGAARFGAIDWPRTLAYSEELDYHPSVWLNLRGREPAGVVDPDAYDAVRERVVEALRTWRDGAGRPVIARVWRREQAYSGPFVDEAPDVMVEPVLVDGYSPSWLRSTSLGPAITELGPRDFAAGKGAGMNGAHRPEGVFALAGPSVRALGACAPRAIADVAPTLLALAGLPVPRGLDGLPMEEMLARPVDWSVDEVPSTPPERRLFSGDEEAAVARRLAALGYLDAEAGE
jgi:predicted AlkP superfamily phosphohydrolase/phosphomutase